MLDEKRIRWQRDATLLKYELCDLQRFRLCRDIFYWAAGQHPAVIEDGAPIISHLIGLHRDFEITVVRRIAKTHPDAASIPGLLSDLIRFETLARTCFPSLPQLSELAGDLQALTNATQPIIALADEAFAHVDRTPSASLWDTVRPDRPDAVDVTLDIGKKYVALLGGPVPNVMAISERELRDTFGLIWVDEGIAIPERLLEGDRL